MKVSNLYIYTTKSIGSIFLNKNKSETRGLPYLYIALLLFLVQCYPTPKLAGQFTEAAFDEMATLMAKGTVKDIEVETLVQEKEAYLLLDTRTKKEYEISHIPNAIWVGYDNFSLNNLPQGISKDTKILTYCSVGYRSERIGEKLQEAGYQDVSNLKGSVFKWINEGHPLEDMLGSPTDKVHGFDKEWGKWVRGGKAVY